MRPLCLTVPYRHINRRAGAGVGLGFPIVRVRTYGMYILLHINMPLIKSNEPLAQNKNMLRGVTYVLHVKVFDTQTTIRYPPGQLAW